LQDFLLQVVDAGGDIDFLTIETDRATGGDADVAVVEGIIEVGRP